MFKDSHLLKWYFEMPPLFDQLLNHSHQIVYFKLSAPLSQNDFHNTHPVVCEGFITQSPGTKLMYNNSIQTHVLNIVSDYRP